MEVRLFDLIIHNCFWKYFVRTCNNELQFLLMLWDKNMWFTSLTWIEELLGIFVWGRPSTFVDGRPFHRRLFYKVPILPCTTIMDELEVGLFHSTPSKTIKVVLVGKKKKKQFYK